MPPSPPTPTLLTNPVPDHWESFSEAQKLEWLATQTCPGNPIESLATVYRRGASTTKYFHCLYAVLQSLAAEFQAPNTDKTRRLFRKLVNAFNEGVLPAMTAIYNDCSYIITYGKLSDEPVLLDAASGEELSPFDDLLLNLPTDDEVWD
ncbi:hypothetical protein G7Z17_g10052 [Cylindrodendrum hubeiense]|uniref:Uncharacterized protein n=1 Tax=Cylindrodendrum hubeiense TaxID=595255 RepID=A0A9P5H3S7_9HYPO|nr:hypothetical protein G7Z17_g10052 [Cylindrodendrum hubeiense]